MTRELRRLERFAGPETPPPRLLWQRVNRMRRMKREQKEIEQQRAVWSQITERKLAELEYKLHDLRRQSDDLAKDKEELYQQWKEKFVLPGDPRSEAELSEVCEKWFESQMAKMDNSEPRNQDKGEEALSEVGRQELDVSHSGQSSAQSTASAS